MANNSASAQKTHMEVAIQNNSSFLTYNSSSIDTSGALNLTITVQKGTTGADFTAEGILVEKIV